MIYKKQEIVDIAIKTMKDIGWGYNSNLEIEPIFKSIDEQLENLKKIDEAGFLPKEIKYEQAIKNIKPYWIVGFDFEEESQIENNHIFLEISDLNGEPFFIKHKQSGMKIQKNNEGKYFTILE